MSAARIVVAAVLAVGLAGTAVALHLRQGNSQFTAAQQNLATVTPQTLATLLRTSHDARPGHRDAQAISARCALPQGARGTSRWSCTVRYPAGPPVVYRVVVAPSGEVTGAARVGFGLVFRGCCVNPPGAPR